MELSPALRGIIIFIPQIIILFGLINILEDTGYMARISFLTDKLMRKAGLNGKSVMPMISGFACAVPAIMSARNIENKRKAADYSCYSFNELQCRATCLYHIDQSCTFLQTLLAGLYRSAGASVMMGLYVLGVVSL